MSSNRKIITFQELVEMPARENGEPLVEVEKYDSSIISQYQKTDMIEYTGEKILVRDTVAKKLAAANKLLAESSKHRLKVIYGYRHPQVQALYFNRRRSELKKEYPDLAEKHLDVLTHNFVAIPSVAGHPTGGAIDVTIVDNNSNEVDMGTGIADFSEPEMIKTFSTGIAEIQKKNRMLLHDVLVKENFAPFYSEWWHFSFGDREWACFYKRKEAYYAQLNFRRKSEF